MIPLHPKVINDQQSNLLQQDGMTLTSDIFKSNPMVYGGGHNTQCPEKLELTTKNDLGESCDISDDCTSGNCEEGKCAADRGEPPGPNGQSNENVDMPCNELTIATDVSNAPTGELFDASGNLKGDYLTCDGEGDPSGIKPNILYGISKLNLDNYISSLEGSTVEDSDTKITDSVFTFSNINNLPIPELNIRLNTDGSESNYDTFSGASGAEREVNIDSDSPLIYQILAIKAFQDDKKKSFKDKVSDLWRDQAALPNDWSSYFTSIYGKDESGNNPIIKELRERDVSTKQLEFDKMLNNEITKFHSLTQQAIQTKQARDFAGTVVETATNQKDKLKADIGRYTSDIMSKDRQIQINQNTYFKILDETKKLKIFYHIFKKQLKLSHQIVKH